MYKFLSKNGQTVGFLLGFAFVAIYLIMVTTGLGDFDSLPREEQFKTGIFNFGLMSAMVLSVLALVLAVAFGLFQFISNPKGSIKVLAVLALIAIIYFIFRGMGAGDFASPIGPTLEKFQITEGVSSYISGAIGTAVALAVLAVIALAISEIINFFK